MKIDLNATQRRIFYAAIAVIVLMGVFPPWHVDMPIAMESNFARTVYLGYGFIGNPCLYNQGSGVVFGGKISFDILMLQWFLIVIFAAGFVCLVKDHDTVF
jgi:hypothetical protein